MKKARNYAIFVVFGVLLSALNLVSTGAPVARWKSTSVPFAFKPVGAASAEEAATTLFQACIKRSPQRFMKHLLLGVCDGPVNSLRKFAGCLHLTKFSDGKDAYTVYDLPTWPRIETVRTLGSQDFDRNIKEVDMLLAFSAVSTYYGEKFVCYRIAATDKKGLEYRTRIIVAMVDDQWYGVPRCKSSKAFYEIADKMQFTAAGDQQQVSIDQPTSEDAKGVDSGVAKVAGRPRQQLSKVEQEYQRLLPLWQEERKKYELSSNTNDYWQGPHGQAIIKLGPAIIPQLIKELRKGDFWFNVPLAKITQVDIATEIDVSEQEKSKLWIKWWERSTGGTKN